MRLVHEQDSLSSPASTDMPQYSHTGLPVLLRTPRQADSKLQSLQPRWDLQLVLENRHRLDQALVQPVGFVEASGRGLFYMILGLHSTCLL